MTTINSLGPRGYQSNLPAATPAAGQRTPANTPAAPAPASSPVSLSTTGAGMQQRVSSLGHATVDLAQNLLNSFTKDLFGDAMAGAAIDFDSVSLDAAASFEAGAMQAQGPDGAFNAAAFRFSESSHFVGKGTITMADGQQYEFEIEVSYEARMEAAAASSVPSRRKELAEQNPAMPLPAVEFPDIDFPGSLADLFKLFDKPIGGDVKKDGDTLGSLSLRLLKLLDKAPEPELYGPGKAVANAYGAPPAAPEPQPAPAEPAPVSMAAPEVVETYTPGGKGDAA